MAFAGEVLMSNEELAAKVAELESRLEELERGARMRREFLERLSVVLSEAREGLAKIRELRPSIVPPRRRAAWWLRFRRGL